MPALRRAAPLDGGEACGPWADPTGGEATAPRLAALAPTLGRREFSRGVPVQCAALFAYARNSGLTARRALSRGATVEGPGRPASVEWRRSSATSVKACCAPSLKARPGGARAVDEAEADERPELVRILWRFRVAHVLDISQTDGVDLADVRPALLAGEAPEGPWDALAAQLADAGYRLERARTKREALVGLRKEERPGALESVRLMRHEEP